jgi:drug/metabolite transporter (DMT)-like permease
VGNIIYYLFLSSAILRAGGPLPTMIIGTLPVVIAVCSNLRSAADVRRHHERLPWRRMLPSLALIAAGIACVNQVELSHLRADPAADAASYALGGVLALGAVLCWTWYPIRNADWLRAHPDRSPRAWATAQGVATLPLALLGFAGFWAWTGLSGSALEMPLGPRPGLFVGLMLAIGLFASWLGTLCWNEASQRLPTTLVGQLIVFETLSALAYALLLRGSAPPWLTGAGVLLLIAGVSWALRIRPEPLPEAAAQPH